MSLRIKADSLRKKFKSVRQRLSPSLADARPNETQPKETQALEIRPPTRRSSSPTPLNNLHISRVVTHDYLPFVRSGTGTPNSDYTKLRVLGPASGHSSPHFPSFRSTDAEPSLSRPHTSHNLDRVIAQDPYAKPKDKGSIESSATTSTNPRVESSDNSTKKKSFNISLSQRAEVGGSSLTPDDMDNDLSNESNKEAVENSKKKKADRIKRFYARMAERGYPDLNVLPSFSIKYRSKDSDSDSDSSSYKDPVNRAKFKAWPDYHLERQRRVIEKYNRGDKLWTKEALIRIEDQIKGDDINVRINGYVGEGQSVQKETNSDQSKLRVQFHGYQELAFPPATKPDSTPYNTMSIKTIPYDYEDSLPSGVDWVWNNCYKGIWRGCPIMHLLYSTFMRIPLPPINKVVCFDLGPLAVRWDDPSRKASRGIYRHLAAMTLIEAMNKRFNGGIHLYAQDPNYSPDCIRILSQKGFEIVGTHGAAGLAKIDEQTLLFAPNPSFCLKEIVADIARPAVMVWNPVLTPEESDYKTKSKVPDSLNDNTLISFHHRLPTDPDTPRVRALMQDYEKHFFPENNLFGKTAIYTRLPLPTIPPSPTRSPAPELFDAVAALERLNADLNAQNIQCNWQPMSGFMLPEHNGSGRYHRRGKKSRKGRKSERGSEKKEEEEPVGEEEKEEEKEKGETSFKGMGYRF
ncbi:uncharacterized protein GGS22DRAFT_118217 [Annulohypoxylon maeteangense]|uniref:uncharacterized protein n=1 Tax=Annulohypoxylon maeteangense TaxID=1927788 RepID=UPI0020085A8A|nr:uncharacterized protein GGS22DRAFT_118217 [Annulohypoxylon maeteangense]KAI0886829.1 hypothetical protein GGS22DRAFT_118217 [Annulohypoxylon maeteangense]